MASENKTDGKSTETQNSGEQAALQANFLQLLSNFGAQALVQLGLMSNPTSNKFERNLELAKYSIDILGVLEEKTKGNLTDEEEKYLSAMLAQLRMGYVKAIGKKDEPAADSETSKSPEPQEQEQEKEKG